MNRETFLDSFGHVAEAPGGINKLRTLILDLAVSGNLVDQDPADEPSAQVIERIGNERAGLIAAKEIRAPTQRGEIPEGDKPYELPGTWSWAWLSDVLLKLTDGTHHSPPNGPSGAYPYVSAKNVKDGYMVLDELTFVSAEHHEEIWARCDPRPGDVLFVKDGATTGNAARVELSEPFSMLSSVAQLRPGPGLSDRYLLIAMRSPTVRSALRGGMKGSAITRTTLSKLAKVVFPLPPTAEQLRIVERVDELMGLCDELDEQQGARTEARSALTASALHRVADAAMAEDVRAAISSFAERIALHLAPGNGDLAAAKRLRQTIFDLAVRGRLTYQDPADLPAAVLLDQIASERDRLIRAKEIRKPKKFDEVTASLGDADLPSGWAWARANQFFIASDSGWSPQCMVESAGPGDWGVLKTSAVSRGVFDPDENKKLPRTLEPRPKLEVQPGEFVMIRASGSKSLVGRGAIVTETESRLMLSDKHIRLTFLHEASTRYWAILNESTAVQAYYSDESSGTSTMSNVTRDRIGALAVAVPPLAEQLRIVEAVDTLLGLCDDLEQQLIAAGSLREDLAASIAAHSVPSRPRELC
ncbi:restriction endonuclease subunit S [Nocardioides sp. MAHUQ-72]|uniref:restriction endonuclease subunit S n=1 Tax=unclassified Nocardioides TaxID=2615069 RepID=UPI0036102D9E